MQALERIMLTDLLPSYETPACCPPDMNKGKGADGSNENADLFL